MGEAEGKVKPTVGGQGGKSGLKMAETRSISRAVGAASSKSVSGTSGLAAVTGRGKKSS